VNHAKYAPSAAERWSLCPGSVRLAARIPEQPPAPWAVEGTHAHALLQLCLDERETDAYFYEGLTLDTATEPWKVDREHCASVQVCLDFVYGLLERADGQLYVERYLPVPQTVVPGDDVGGTADICVYFPSSRQLHVIDFKHGEGVVVEIRDNKQVRMYALAALQEFPDPIDEIVLTIVQPRAYHPFSTVRSETVTPRQLVEFQGDVEAWITACEAADAPLIAGEVQCRFCPAKAFCPALEARALELFGKRTFPEAIETVLPQPAEMSAERIATILDAWDIFEGWFKAIQKYATEQIAAGGQIPGWKLVRAQERRKWAGEPQDIAEKFVQLTDCDLDDIYPRTLVGIVAAEKMVKARAQLNVAKEFKKQAIAKGLEAMAELTVKESSGNAVLVSEDDPRPPLSPAELFAAVKVPRLTS